MTPSELWTQTFGPEDPEMFWARAKAEGCQQADEAVGLALAALDGPSEPVSIECYEVLSRYLAACVPGLPLDAEHVLRLPGW